MFDADAYRQHASRRDLVLAIAEAIRGDQFVLCYRPRSSLQDGCLVGAEALLRWFPDGRACPPSEVIAAIRDSDLQRELDSWVIGIHPSLRGGRHGDRRRRPANATPRDRGPRCRLAYAALASRC